MSTQVMAISNNSIKLNKNSVTVTLLRDPKTSLYFHYSKVNRDKGVFYARIYKNGEDKKVRIGKYPEISAQRAHQAISNIHLKDDCFAHNELRTMAQLCDWYINRTKSNKQIKVKTAKQTVSLITNHIRPYLAHLVIDEVNEWQIDQHWFTPIQSKLALSTIALALVTINAMFTWATKLKLLSKNPVDKLSIANFTHQRPEPKVGKLTDVKLKRSLKRLNEFPMQNQLLHVLLLLHGTRIGETTNAQWDAFDFKTYLWRIPASDTKTKKPHVLPLSPIAIEWLKAYRRYQYRTNRSKYLFPQKTNKRKPQSANVSSRLMSSIGKGEWTAHDIRKYVRSSWLENGVDYLIGELLLNHSLSKLDQSYIQTTAMNLCREALVQWGDSLVGLGLPKPSFSTAQVQS
jgi:integrase